MSARVAPLLALLLTACAGAAPYARCSDADDCASGVCARLLFTRSDGTPGEGSLCTVLDCASDDDCPDDGACLALEGMSEPRRTFCVARCTAGTSGECAGGTRCTALTGHPAIAAACLP